MSKVQGRTLSLKLYRINWDLWLITRTWWAWQFVLNECLSRGNNLEFIEHWGYLVEKEQWNETYGPWCHWCQELACCQVQNRAVHQTGERAGHFDLRIKYATSTGRCFRTTPSCKRKVSNTQILFIQFSVRKEMVIVNSWDYFKHLAFFFLTGSQTLL